MQGAVRMENLLKDLRAYTQASTMDTEPTGDIDAGEILKKTLLNLEVAIKDSGASISSTTLPRVRMHEFQLEQVFQNLIGNAIRYRSSAPPQIHIAAERSAMNGVSRFKTTESVSPLNSRSRIFGIFKRLHTAARNIPAPGWGWPSANGSLNGAGDESGWNRNQGEVRRFTSRFQGACRLDLRSYEPDGEPAVWKGIASCGDRWRCARASPCGRVADETRAVYNALEHPVGTRPLREIAQPGERVAIIVNDITRLTRTDLLLPPIIDTLNKAGIVDSDIFIVFALGIHRPQTEEERRLILGGEIFSASEISIMSRPMTPIW